MRLLKDAALATTGVSLALAIMTGLLLIPVALMVPWGLWALALYPGVVLGCGLLFTAIHWWIFRGSDHARQR